MIEKVFEQVVEEFGVEFDNPAKGLTILVTVGIGWSQLAAHVQDNSSRYPATFLLKARPFVRDFGIEAFIENNSRKAKPVKVRNAIFFCLRDGDDNLEVCQAMLMAKMIRPTNLIIVHPHGDNDNAAIDPHMSTAENRCRLPFSVIASSSGMNGVRTERMRKAFSDSREDGAVDVDYGPSVIEAVLVEGSY